MNMLEDMQKMMMLEQQMQSQGGQQPQGFPLPGMQQQFAPQMPQAQGMQSPIEMGSMAALNSTKRSLQMSESENQRALGRALLTMMSSMNKNPSYGNGFSGTLGAMAEGMIPALFEYDEEQKRIANMNDYLLRQKKEEAALARKEDREMKRMAHEMAMQKQNLAINQGYLNLKRQEREDERKLEDEMTKAGTKIPLGRLSNHPTMYNNAMADIKSYLDKREASIPALQAIDTIENVLTRDPDITKHWGVIALAAQRKDPGYVNQQLANKVPEKTRYHAELLAKSLATLPVSKFKGVPAKGLTVFAEKLISGMSPSMDMSSKSILKMVKPDKKFYSHTIKAGDEVYENLEKGIRYIPKPMEVEFEKWEEDEGENPYLGMSGAELDSKEAELRKMLSGYQE
jgi:hypothetical protein